MDKLLYRDVMEHNNKNEPLTEQEWILKGIMLGKGSQTQRTETVRHHSYKTIEWARLIYSEMGDFLEPRVGWGLLAVKGHDRIFWVIIV